MFVIISSKLKGNIKLVPTGGHRGLNEQLFREVRLVWTKHKDANLVMEEVRDVVLDLREKRLRELITLLWHSDSFRLGRRDVGGGAGVTERKRQFFTRLYCFCNCCVLFWTGRQNTYRLKLVISHTGFILPLRLSVLAKFSLYLC